MFSSIHMMTGLPNRQHTHYRGCLKIKPLVYTSHEVYGYPSYLILTDFHQISVKIACAIFTFPVAKENLAHFSKFRHGERKTKSPTI